MIWGYNYPGNFVYVVNWGIELQTPYNSTFAFSLGSSQLRSGDTAEMEMSGVNNCSNAAWSSHMDPVTLTIVTGSQYASLHRRDPQTRVDTKIGSVATTIGDNAGQYFLVADGIQPESAVWVKVEAQSNGMTDTDSTQVIPSAVKLVILQPVANSANEHIISAPGMPTVKCEAQLQNYSGGEVTYNWMYSTADTFAQETAKD